MTNRIIRAILFFLGLLVLFTPHYILPVCEYHGYNKMACSYTGIAEMFIGFIIMTISVGIFLSKPIDMLRWAAVTIIVTGVTVVLLPETIGYCHSSKMPCTYGTIPALRLLGAMIILLSFIGFLLSFKKNSRR